METMVDTASRPSAALPSIGHLDALKTLREEEQSRRIGPLPSPSSLYAFGRDTQSHQGSNGTAPGIITPPGSRRTSGVDGTRPALTESKFSVVPPPPRQSLPSIHEALGREPVINYSVTPSAQNTAPTSMSSYFPHPSPTASSEESRRDPASTSFASAPPPPPPPKASQRAASPQLSASLQSGSLPAPIYTAQAPRIPPLKMIRTLSPPHSRSGLTYPPPQQTPRHYEQSPQSAPPNPSFGYPGHQPQYPYSSSSTSSYPAPSAVMSAPPHHTTWPVNKIPGRKLEPKAYDHSIKRKIEEYELDSTLYDLANCGGLILETAGECAKRVNNCKNTGELPSKVISLADMERLSDQLSATQRYFARLQETMHQSHAEQIEQQKEFTRQFPHGRPESYSQYGHNTPEDVHPPVSDPNKQRKRGGRAAPPGRCHSCNRAETPEWRRGPDGARTLCNACGLHYAKLTRKMGSGAKLALANSNLRPKS